MQLERKKIDVRDLQLGMYIAELDRPWLETPFMYQGFELQSPEALKKLQELCRYVWIDIRKGIDFTPARGHGQAAYARMQRLAEEEDQIRNRVRQLAQEQQAAPRKPYTDQTTLEQEITEARAIDTEARDALRTAFDDVARGRPVDLALAQKVVTRMVDSIIRNPDALVCLSQLKDVSEYTALHSVRSCVIALAFGRHLALSRDELGVLGLGALLHDVGMARLPRDILARPGRLGPKEFELLKRHVLWGIEIARSSGDVPPGALEVIEQHHERGDGSGYIAGRSKNMITPAGYMGAIVDVYDAVTSDRSYSGALSAEDALKSMYEWRHKDFTPALVEEFIRCMGIFPIGSLVELSTGSIGVVITINRTRRLKPKVALVLTASKTPYSQRIVTDLMEHKDGMGKEIKIARVLPSGSYGIQPMDYLVQI
jgi:HD-GYP domain-containing protein (c-di-GMP phosphodiesterase class II)